MVTESWNRIKSEYVKWERRPMGAGFGRRFFSWNLVYMQRFGQFIQRAEGVSQIFPFGQQLIEDRSIRGRSAVEKDDRTRMDPAKQFLKRLFFGRLFILIPVDVSKAPKKRWYTPDPSPSEDSVHYIFPVADDNI